jgi:outer membrane lipoprotein-sorting protein
MMRRSWLVLGGMCLAQAMCWSGAQAADEVFRHPQSAQQLLDGPLSAPAATLRAAQTLRGNFEFKKFLREIPQPLVSRGTFVYVRNLGIDWHTLQPFDSELILTADGLTQFDDGKASVSMKAGEQPAVKVIADIFLALMSLDVTALQKTFVLSGLQQGQHWQLGLKPRGAAVSRVFKEALIKGRAQVESLELRDTSGDRTIITFTQLTTGATVSPGDRAIFSASQR